MFSMEDQTHELEFKESIIGLVTREEFLAKKKRLLGNTEEQQKFFVNKKRNNSEPEMIEKKLKHYKNI